MLGSKTFPRWTNCENTSFITVGLSPIAKLHQCQHCSETLRTHLILKSKDILWYNMFALNPSQVEPIVKEKNLYRSRNYGYVAHCQINPVPTSLRPQRRYRHPTDISSQVSKHTNLTHILIPVPLLGLDECICIQTNLSLLKFLLQESQSQTGLAWGTP